MRSARRVYGEIGQCESPDWGPLEGLLASDELCAYFMWMGDIELEDGTILQAYNHRWTRRYLHLTSEGLAFKYAGGFSYDQIDPYDAISAVFADWLCCEPTAAEKAALRAALIAAD